MVILAFGMTSKAHLFGWLGRLAAKPLSAASQSESREWAWHPDSLSDKSDMKSGMTSGMKY